MTEPPVEIRSARQDEISQTIACRDEMFLRANLRMFEHQYEQYMDGTLDDSIWAGYLENMRRTFTPPAFRDFWEANRGLYSTDFSAFVDSRMRGGHGQSDAA